MIGLAQPTEAPVPGSGAQARPPAPASEMAGLAADSRTVALWTLVSRITGFGRVAAMAAVLGPTFFGNLFQTAHLLPNVVHELLTGSLIAALLVPPLVRCLDLQDRARAARLANGFLGILMLTFSAVVVLSIMAAPLLVGLITIAVDDPAVRDRQLDLGWWLLALFMPQLLFYGIAATGAAVQHAHRRFALAAAAPAVENLGTMAVMAAAALTFGMGMDVDRVTVPQLVFLGIGCTMPVAAHAALQWWGAYRAGITLLPSAGWRDEEVRRIVRLAVPSSGHTALNGATFFGLLVVAGSVPGGAVAFHIGFTLFNLPVALCARPVAAAQLPRLAESFGRGDWGSFQATYRGSLALTLFVALPASLLFLALPGTLAGAVSFGGMATPAGIGLVAAAIAGLGVGIMGEAAFQVSTSACYARRDAVSPLLGMVARTAIAFAGMAVVAWWVAEPTMVLWLLGIFFAFANLVAAACVHLRQERLMPAVGGVGRPAVVGNLMAALIAMVPGVAIARALGELAAPGYQTLGVAGAALTAVGLSYLLIQWLRGSEELRSLFSGLASRTRPPRGSQVRADEPCAGAEGPR